MLKLPARTIAIGEGVVAFAVLLGFVVSLQWLAGAYASGFGGYPDESAHLVTSLMVRDFIASLDYRHPWQFAQQYYLHYPKVAIGHWPPLFYAELGTWFLIIGASRRSALIFIALIAAATASIIYFTGKRLIGRWAGILAAVLFVASPLVQESSVRVMTEHAATLGMLVATLWFARFANTGRVGDGLAFGAISAAAILTHGDAWALALVPSVTVALTNRWYLLRRPGLWLGALPVLATCVPWYVFTLHMQQGSWEGDAASFWVQAVPDFSLSIGLAVGFPVIIFALIGIWSTIIQINSRAQVMLEWSALAGLAIATFVLHCVLPVGLDPRYMTSLLPSIVLFSAAGIDYVGRRFSTRLPIGLIQIGLAAVLLAAFSVESFAFPLRLRNGGYERLVREVEVRIANAPQVWLISSDATGEGCLAAAVALHERRPGSYVLLGKKILAGGDWLARNTVDRFDTPEKLATLLEQIPVTIIAIDEIPNQLYPYQARLRKLVADETDRWQLIGSYPQIKEGVNYPNSLHVYARRPVAALTLGPPALQINLVRELIGGEELR